MWSLTLLNIIILGEVRDYMHCRTALLFLYLHSLEFSLLLWVAETLPRCYYFLVLAWRPVPMDIDLLDLNICWKVSFGIQGKNGLLNSKMILRAIAGHLGNTNWKVFFYQP